LIDIGACRGACAPTPLASAIALPTFPAEQRRGLGRCGATIFAVCDINDGSPVGIHQTRIG
jgi:hypothetical protein